ncbi:5-oxoprolinase subunit PxpB [Streptococcus moroccensis]|uniref:KipI family sensor histidine kinase inhibitor n=1 Tax=Streptococcus moroccensis TaxID=1451356 RepID=A0ABT9YTX6_9STRE|nr:5-oxoprolinase subunit PxpB [Streptococcus moroccensis]MDQ0223450.1 KipI family sensor histidine kinase inhibitor [Streptococcus moroccensis]
MTFTIKTAGDSAVLLTFEQAISPDINHQIKSLLFLLKEQPISGIIDIIPAFASLLISYDPRVITFARIKNHLLALQDAKVSLAKAGKRIFEIPVCYGGNYGPDLPFVAQNAGLTEEDVIAIHSSQDYLIYMLGFLPGFPYLGGLDDRIHTPRLDNPRLAIPAGSVGIGGNQTGIYPLESPGGWQLIGRTPIETYQPNRQVPILFEAGDYIRFKPVSEEEFGNILAAVKADNYQVTIIREEGSHGH